MGFLKNFFSKNDEQQKYLASLKRQIDSFMRPSRSLLSERILTIPKNRVMYSLFTFGAIYALDDKDKQDETRALAVLVMHLRDLEGFSENEVNFLISRCIHENQSEKDIPIIESGYKAILKWKESPGEAVELLREMFASFPE